MDGSGEAEGGGGGEDGGDVGGGVMLGGETIHHSHRVQSYAAVNPLSHPACLVYVLSPLQMLQLFSSP